MWYEFVAMFFLIFADVHCKRLHHPNASRINVTACDSFGVDGKNETLSPGPLTRIVTMCREDLSQLCTLVEFRAHLHVFYPLGSNQTGCHTVPLDLRSSLSQTSTTESDVPSSNVSDDFKSDSNPGPDIERVLTTEEACCTTFVRCFTIPLGKTPDDPLYGWRLNFTWERTPEPYEFGEVGWSSVGAPIGSLSGVYDLVNVQLIYVLNQRAGFPVLPTISDQQQQRFVVSSSANERFQARVGDFYECASPTSIVLEPSNETATEESGPSGRLLSEEHSVLPGYRVILVLMDLKTQAFADVNVPEFTGASVVCVGDTSHDGTISIVIGLSICALVILVLIGLVISHLRDRDRSFKIVETVEH